MLHDYDENPGCWEYFWGMLETIGFFIALLWPILMFFFHRSQQP